MTPVRRLSREQRAERAAELADIHGGVAHRRDLRAAGITYADIRSEVSAGRWLKRGRHTVQTNKSATPAAAMWMAVWESGSGAALDGGSALIAAGLTGFTPMAIDVSIPANNRRWRTSGVVLHQRSTMPAVIRAGVPRVRPELAVVHAVGWARSEREAALILCLAVQQRLIHGNRLAGAWERHSHQSMRVSRRTTMTAVVRDLVDGAQSLGELDLAALGRAWGIPAPTRQVVRYHRSGRWYLDAVWEDACVVVEVDGIQHTVGTAPVEDAIRQNEVVLGDERVLRMPVLGLRLQPDAFMEQLARALRGGAPHRAA